MAVITQTPGVSGSKNPQVLARTTLTTSDTFVFQRGSRQFLHLRGNGTVTSVTFTGSAPSTVVVPGLGGTVDGSVGLVATIPATSGVGLLLDLDQYFIIFGDGPVTITTAAGCIVSVWN